MLYNCVIVVIVNTIFFLNLAKRTTPKDKLVQMFITFSARNICFCVSLSLLNGCGLAGKWHV